MNDENESNLDVVFGNCQNDFESFLSTIANYLAKKPNFATFDCQHVSGLFEEVQSSAKNHTLSKQPEAIAHESSMNATNGKGNAPIPTNDGDDSGDMFDQEEDEIIPETQFLEESIDSNESEIILPNANKDDNHDQFNDESNAESEILQVRPDSQMSDHTELQSQMVINLDRSLMRCIDDATNDRQEKNSEALPTTAPTEADSISKEQSNVKEKTYLTEMEELLYPTNASNVDRGDRSRSTTPDLDFTTTGSTRDGEKDAEAEPQAELHENGNDLDETQMFSQNIFDANTQRSSPQQTQKDDIYLAATQASDFLPPALTNSSTLRSNAKQNTTVDAADDVFSMATQKGPEFLHPAPVNSSTPRTKAKQNTVVDGNGNDEEDIFAIATQQGPESEFLRPAPVNSSTPRTKAKQSVTAEKEHDYVYDDLTQALPSDKSPATKKSVTWKLSNQNQANNTSDDLFDVETQLFEQPEFPRADLSTDLDDTVFDNPTQIMEYPENLQTKRFPAVLTQCSQPANTPEWSLAARITNSQIEEFEQRQEVLEAQKRREKLKKNKYLFSSSSEEEDDDDIELDLPKPFANKIGNKEILTNRKPIETAKRTHSDDQTDDDDDDDKDDPPPNKRHSKDMVIPKKILERRLSVKLTRSVVDEFMRKESDAEKMKMSREHKKDVETTETNVDKTGHRSLRTRKSLKSVESNQNKRKPDSSVADQVQPREKRHKESEKPKTVTTSSKSKDADFRSRTGKKDKDKAKAKENDEKSTIVTTKNNSPLATFQHRYSDRTSTRQSSRYAILFTKVNPSPYVQAIQDLGGFIVDTPQLGNVLICDKISRTFKFLYALSKGIPVVTSHWLDASVKNGAFEPTNPYLVVDKMSEKRFHFSLRKSLELARQRPLFTDYHIFATAHVQPTPDEISEIVQGSGGKYSDNPLKKCKPNTKAVLISNKKDYKLWDSYRKAHPDIQIVNSEGFMQSVVQQKINFPDYTL